MGNNKQKVYHYYRCLLQINTCLTPHVSLKKEGEGEYYNNTDDEYYVMIIPRMVLWVRC